jgi:quercetin dioxygenase-like cupin family protein
MTEEQAGGTAVNQATRKTIMVGQLGVRFLVEAGDSDGSVTVFECYVPANARVPAPHSHNGFEETVYGLKGTLTFTIEGERVEIGPGQGVCIPRGTVHGFANVCGDDAKFLAIATPGVLGPAYFEEIGGVLAAAGGGPPEHAAIAEVMHHHGVTPAPVTKTAKV